MNEPSDPVSWTAPSCEEMAAEFPRLSIQQLLRTGAAGAVYLVRQEDLDRLAVLKVLRPEAGADAAMLGRFRQEARALALLRDPGIMAVYDSGTSPGGYLYLLLEHGAGGDLHAWVQARGGVTAEELLRIGGAVAKSLAAAHRSGIVHGAIRPEVIYYDADAERFKLGEFTLAGFEGLSAAAEGAGSGVAPEIAAGECAMSAQADVYALGAALADVLTDTELPPAAAQVLTAALAEDPAQRTAGAEVFAALLLSAAENCRAPVIKEPAAPRAAPRPVLHAPSAPRVVVPAKKKTQSRAVPVAAAVMLSGAAGAWLMLREPDGKAPDAAPPAVAQAPPETPPPAAPPETTPVPPVSTPPAPVKPPAMETAGGEEEANFAAWIKSEGGADAVAKAPPATLEDVQAWNPDWKVDAPPPGAQDGARFSRTPEDGVRVLAVHPYSRTQSGSFTREVALPAQPPQQLSVRVAAMHYSYADWLLRAYAGDEPLGPPVVIHGRVPETERFRTVTWDLSRWQGREVRLRVEFAAGGERSWSNENAYFAWIRLEPKASAAEMLATTAPAALTPAQAAVFASVKDKMSQMDAFRDSERQKLHATIRRSRQQAAAALKDRAQAKSLAESDPAAPWLTPAELAAASGKAALEGTWIFPGDKLVEFHANGTISPHTDGRWRWLDQSRGIFAHWSDRVDGYADVGRVDGARAVCINGDDYRFDMTRKETTAARGPLPPAVLRTLEQEERWRQESQSTVRTKALALIEWVKMQMKGQPAADVATMSARMTQALEASLGKAADGKSPEDLRYLSDSYNTGLGPIEFRRGGILAFGGNTAGKWVWCRDDLLMFCLETGGSVIPAVARISKAEKGIIRLNALSGGGLGNARRQGSTAEPSVIYIRGAGGAPLATVPFRGRRFCCMTEPCSWLEAKARCAKMGGRLAVIPDEETWAFIHKLGGGRAYWLGATDEAAEGEWKWVDGTAMTFNAWKGRQPDNNGGKENYLQMGWHKGWNDSADNGENGDHYIAGYVCEWPE